METSGFSVFMKETKTIFYEILKKYNIIFPVVYIILLFIYGIFLPSEEKWFEPYAESKYFTYSVYFVITLLVFYLLYKMSRENNILSDMIILHFIIVIPLLVINFFLPRVISFLVNTYYSLERMITKSFPGTVDFMNEYGFYIYSIIVSIGLFTFLKMSDIFDIMKVFELLKMLLVKGFTSLMNVGNVGGDSSLYSWIENFINYINENIISEFKRPYENNYVKSGVMISVVSSLFGMLYIYLTTDLFPLLKGVLNNDNQLVLTSRKLSTKSESTLISKEKLSKQIDMTDINYTYGVMGMFYINDVDGNYNTNSMNDNTLISFSNNPKLTYNASNKTFKIETYNVGVDIVLANSPKIQEKKNEMLNQKLGEMNVSSNKRPSYVLTYKKVFKQNVANKQGHYHWVLDKRELYTGQNTHHTNQNYKVIVTETNDFNLSISAKELYKLKMLNDVELLKTLGIEDKIDQSLIDEDEANTVVFSSDEIPIQKWNTFAVNYKNGYMDIFINGSLVGTYRNKIPDFVGDITVGTKDGLPNWVDRIMFSKVPLSRDDMKQYYNISIKK